jgi:hypothetical protein
MLKKSQTKTNLISMKFGSLKKSITFAARLAYNPKPLKGLKRKGKVKPQIPKGA